MSAPSMRWGTFLFNFFQTKPVQPTRSSPYILTKSYKKKKEGHLFLPKACPDLKFVCFILKPVFAKKTSTLCRTDFYIIIELLQLINDNYDNFTKNQKKKFFLPVQLTVLSTELIIRNKRQDKR